MTEIPKANQIYRHFKGNLYKIITPAVHSETGTPMIVYQALYGEYTVYVRELSVFMGKVDKQKYPDIAQEDRFELVTQIIGQEAGGVQTPPVQEMRQEPRPRAVSQETQQEVRSEAVLQETQQEVRSEAVLQETQQGICSEAAAQGRQQEASAPQQALDPMLLQFLDADTYEEKLNLLIALHARITDEMINTMAVSLDVEINDGELADRYEALKTCLLTLEKYECSRLR